MRLSSLLILLFIFACADIKVRSSQDPNINFNEYNNWYWLNGCTPSYEGPNYIDADALLTQMVNAIAVEMQSKGYPQNEENPDLLLNFRITTKEDSATSALIHEESLPLWEYEDENDIYYHFLVGTLIIDIYDREKGKIIWRSLTEKYLPIIPKVNPIEIKKGIKKALKKFPKNKP